MFGEGRVGEEFEANTGDGITHILMFLTLRHRTTPTFDRGRVEQGKPTTVEDQYTRTLIGQLTMLVFPWTGHLCSAAVAGLQ